MRMIMKTKILTLILTSLIIISCSNDDKQTQGSQSTVVEVAKESKLVSYISKENVCNLIVSTDKLKQSFNIQIEINVSGNEYNGSAYCDYSWDRADKAEREEKYKYYLSDSMSGKIKKISKRMRTSQSSFRIKLSETSIKADRFVPEVKSEEAIQKLVDAAKKSTSDALTDEQKALAGDSANNMVESLIRKSNQTTEIKNLGDAAYWSNLMDGMMYVLDGNANIELSIIQIGNTIEEDKDNAAKIARLLVEAS
jgi:hypothetical protein